MPGLMGQNSQNLFFGVRAQEGVKENNPFGPAQTDEKSVCMFASLTRIHFEDSFGLESDLFHQPPDAFFEAYVFNRIKFVE
jgi:hypothetical protein